MADEIRDDLTSVLIEKKKDNWGESSIRHNFTLPNELTVEITLDEYRNLIKAEGEYERKRVEEENKSYKLYKENEALKEENQKLKEKVCDLIAQKIVKDDEKVGEE